MTTTDMNQVAASEFDVLSVLRALFDAPAGRPGGGPAGGVASRRPTMVSGLLKQSRPVAAGMGPTALRLARDTLAKGLILALVRRGGWRRGWSVDGDRVVHGRLWERHDPPMLHVSPFALHLCRWLVEQELRSTSCDALEHAPVTMADELLLYLALDLTHGARCSDALAAQPAARGSALCWLGFADVLARHLAAPAEILPADVSVYAFVPWTSASGALLLEALQPDLARRWIEMEHDKRRVGSGAELVAIGRIQEAVLEAFFAAADSARRRDLAAFAADATRALVDERPDARAWLPLIDAAAPLRVRSSAARAQVVLLRAMDTLARWAHSAGAVRFFDDGYDPAQLFLRLWEPLGDSGYGRATAIASQMESIETLVS